MTGKSILIADDDRDLVTALSVRCEQLGLQVATAHNCLEAVNIANEAPPDVICLDVHMPSGNGLSVCEMIAHNAKLRDVPVIILTGNQDEATIRRCHHMCAYYVLKCPDVWGRILPLLSELLRLPACSAKHG